MLDEGELIYGLGQKGYEHRLMTYKQFYKLALGIAAVETLFLSLTKGSGPE
jgi:hypothetical protein